MHILAAEDNAINQKVLSRILQKLPGCAVSFVSNGQEALDYLSAPPSTCPRPDIILMDLAMPVMAGYEAISIIRTQQQFTSDPWIPTTPIVALTASRARGEHERLLFRGFDDVLVKPTRQADVRRAIMYWSTRRVVPRPNGPLAVSRMGNMIPIRPEAVWGPPLRNFRGPRSLL
ncbi:response regulator [Aspergillus undulatus]|uniref:response regulator n=1 Tax=Aspergillus undulatus TaxID=1810928 RepID=UPI003CCE44D3